MSSDEIAISVRNLTKTYRLFSHPGDRVKQFFSLGMKQYHREFTALNDVSFEIKKGETIGIIGRNGSGKSTLLQLVCGILKPTSGSVTVNGRVSALLELGAGFNPEFTGRENVYFHGALMGFSKAQMDARLDDILAFADIGEFIDQPVRTYSSGMFVRLAFAVMTQLESDILVIDEALSVGDTAFIQKCMRFLDSFRQRGTLLFVSHDVHSVLSLCNRAIWLEGGNIRSDDLAKISCEAYLNEVLGIQEHGHFTLVGPDDCQADQRHAAINASQLRNDLEIFSFNLTEMSGGTGRVRIVGVTLEDDNHTPFGWVVGGELVNLAIRAEVLDNLLSPIIGFFVKNHLGQSIFGDNTYLRYADAPLKVKAGELLEARFRFRMPYLPLGGYSITVAIAEGSQHQCVTHHLLHEAMTFQSHRSSVGQVMLGLPMRDIQLNVKSQDAISN